MESLLEERAQDKEKIKELEEEVRSRTGSQGTAEEEPAAPAEEQAPAAAEEEKGVGTPAKEKDPHLTAIGRQLYERPRKVRFCERRRLVCSLPVRRKALPVEVELRYRILVLVCRPRKRMGQRKQG